MTRLRLCSATRGKLSGKTTFRGDGMVEAASADAHWAGPGNAMGRIKKRVSLGRVDACSGFQKR
jgi:hypothetical protein